MKGIYDRVLEEIRGAWRFRRAGMITAWLICLIGWGLILLIPATYRASTRIFVDARTTLSEVTQGITVEPNVEGLLVRVSQSLLGGPELERVVRETHPQIAQLPPEQAKALVDNVRKRIVIEGSTRRDSPTGGVFEISYTDYERERALKVVQLLNSRFVANSKGGKKEGTDRAQQFLVDQIAEYESRLSAAEQRLADFKKSNVGQMPGTQGDYFARLQQDMESQQRTRTALSVAVRRRDELTRQMRGEQPILSSGGSSQPRNSGPASGSSNDTASRIRDAETRLEELLLRFTDQHPDVIALRETIDSLKGKQDAEVEALRRGDPGAAVSSGLASNPVFQSIQLALNQTNVEIAALQGELGDRNRSIAQAQKLLNSTPEVEADLAKLNRDYEVTRAQYQVLLERLQKTRLSEQADATGVVQFQEIEPPSSPFSPVAPARGALDVLVLMIAAGCSLALMYVLNQVKPVFQSERQLASFAQLPVLGSVNMTWLDDYYRSHRRSLAMNTIMAGALVAACVTVIVTTRY